MTALSAGRGADQAPYDPLNPSHVGDPAARLADARRRCPVSEPRPGVFVVANHADVADVLQDPATHSSHDNFVLEGGTKTAELPAAVITMLDPPEHTALRARLRRWFAPAKLRQQEGRVREIVAGVLSEMEQGQQIEVWTMLGRPIPSRTVYAFLGLPEQDWDTVQTWSDIVSDHLPQVEFEMPENLALIGYLSDLVSARAAALDASPDVASADTEAMSGVLDGLLRPEGDEEPLTPVEVVMHCMQLILAGTDTTGSLMTGLLYELLVDPARWRRLVDDPALIPRAVEESLRHDAPLQYVLRKTTGDTAVRGCPVASGDRLVVSLQSANLDEQFWGDNAADFDLDRDAGQAPLMTFGYGVHTCLGAPLARLEARLLLEGLVTRFPTMRLAPGYVRQPAERSLVRRPARLDVVL